MDPLVGHALDLILAVAGQSSLEFTASIHPVQDAQAQARAERAVDWIRRYSGVEFRYDSTQVIITEGTRGEPNAFCTGPSFYIAKDLVHQLNDRELIAVLAHEMAHAEEGHLTERMSFGASAALIQLGRVIASDAHAIATGGDADAFMRELWAKGEWKMIQEMIEAGTLGQEMDADCDAYRWLSHMRSIGLDNQPEDLVSAMATLIGVSPEELPGDDFMGRRASVILSGACAS